MRYRDITEAPLGDYQLHGDWSNDRHVATPVIDGSGAIVDPKSPPGAEREIDAKGNSFASRFDRAMVQDPRTEAALRRSLVHLAPTFHLLFLNGPEGLRIAQSYLDHGRHTPGDDHVEDALGSEMLGRLAALRDRDPQSIIVLLTHNEGGTARHLLTPWMIVHRLAHASQYLFRYERMLPTGDMQRPTTGEQILYQLSQCYDHGVVIEPRFEDEMLLQLCTFKAARDNTINDALSLEVGCELMTQYMMTKKVTLKLPETMKIGYSHFPLKHRQVDKAKRLIQELEDNLNASFIQGMVGHTYIC